MRMRRGPDSRKICPVLRGGEVEVFCCALGGGVREEFEARKGELGLLFFLMTRYLGYQNERDDSALISEGRPDLGARLAHLLEESHLVYCLG